MYSNVSHEPVISLSTVFATDTGYLRLTVNPGYEPASAELPRRSSISSPTPQTPPITAFQHRHNRGEHALEIFISLALYGGGAMAVYIVLCLALIGITILSNQPSF